MKRKKLKKILLTDFSKFEPNAEYEIEKLNIKQKYNILTDTKTAKNGYGIKEATFPKTKSKISSEIGLDYTNLGSDVVEGILHFKQYFPNTKTTQDRLLVYSSNKKMYIHQLCTGLGDLFWLYNLQFEDMPKCLTYKLNGNDTAILSSSNKMVVWTTNLSPYTAQNVPIITSMTISNNILFCTMEIEKHKIWYCLSSDPELIGLETTNTKSISLDDERGGARKIITFKENVYVFRDYGITRLNYISESNVDVKHIYLSNSQIIASSTTMCGDIIMFLTRDGLYSFDGINVKKCLTGLEKRFDINNSEPIGACLQDKYYLAIRLIYDDNDQIVCENEEEYKNNSIIVLNLKDFSYDIMRGMDIKCMLPLKTEYVEKLLLVFNSTTKSLIGEISSTSSYMENNLKKSFTTNKVRTSNSNKMSLKSLKIMTSANTTITLKTDQGDLVFTTQKNGESCFDMIEECSNFSVSVASLSDDFYCNYIEINYYD